MVVSTLLLEKNNKILLIKKPRYNFYAAPGGKHEDNETPKEAAIRELYEETGLVTRNATLKAITHVITPSKVFDMYTFYANEFEGELLAYSREGELVWEDSKNLKHLPMPEGDRIVLSHALENNNVLEINVKYSDDYKLESMEVLDK